jgi:CRISPR-associated protein Csb1
MTAVTDTARLDEYPGRTLAAIPLRVAQGQRFQPASYANLGPAVFATPDGVAHLQVDGHAACANWLEAVGWDDDADAPHPALGALPYVRVQADDGTPLTSSRTDSHRLASAYVLDGAITAGRTFRQHFVEEAGLQKNRPIDWARVARVCFRYDPLALVHGVFFSMSRADAVIPGNPKFARMVSAFVEAADVRPASRGGVRFDRVQPQTKEQAQAAETGYGHVPLPIADDYTAAAITLYWSLDRSALAATHLPDPARELLEAVALWQLRRLLDGPIKPRTFCDLVGDAPEGLPDEDALVGRIGAAAAGCAADGLFADPLVTIVTWVSPGKAKS